MSYKENYSSKKWLNPDTTAFIFTAVFRDYENSWATLKVADCAKIVEFDAYVHTNKHRNELSKKVRILIDELTKFDDVINGLSYE